MANNTKKTIIVPWDFTERSEIALAHAYQLAQVVGDNIMLVSIVHRPVLFLSVGKKNRFEEHVEEMRDRLENEATRLKRQLEAQKQSLSEAMQNEVTTQRRDLLEVSILTMVLGFSNLRRALKELYISMEVNLVLAKQDYLLENGKSLNLVNVLRKVKMGKVDTVPFVIVNALPTHKYYTELVVPMDYDKTYKETLRWVAYLSNYYHCNVNMIKPPVNDEGKKKGMANNLYFTKKILDSKNVVYGIKTANRKGDFRSEVLKFTKAIDADLLIIMTDKMKKYFGSLVISADVPVMFVNPLSKRYQNFY